MDQYNEIDKMIEETFRQYGMLFPETLEEVEAAEKEYEEAIASGRYVPKNPTLPVDFFDKEPQMGAKSLDENEFNAFTQEMGMAARSGSVISKADWERMNKDREESEKRNGKRP
jgi:hypothetical protein